LFCKLIRYIVSEVSEKGFALAIIDPFVSDAASAHAVRSAG
jgi:hypothetical protein